MTIAINAIAIKGEDMRSCELFLVKVLYFELDDLSPEFLRWVRVPFRQLAQTPAICRPLEENMSSHKASSRRVEGLKGSIMGRGRIHREVARRSNGFVQFFLFTVRKRFRIRGGHTVRDGVWVTIWACRS